MSIARAARAGSTLLLILFMAAPAGAQVVEGEAPGGPDAGVAGARPEAPEPDTDRRLNRDETPTERRARETRATVFDEHGRHRDPREQNSRGSGVAVDRLRRDQRPDYSVGPGVNIIRRQP
ncbi:hypothetical protein G5B40_00720 [Pikeienuella piscinae]|uniref:Uncharacterized protein n=1 Tax=Pikeienuella piscinae TaxID=2748098 RepID=A0A7L5BTJ6_9RHOB|nr:hypothetical protein [Pikeienuella piscinae]QIE54093.1 hypothetical protein G5B40_00720 [Pikeienuella piscinae]